MNQSENVKKVFLLGGHDLEMMTIKGLLEDRNMIVVDKGLSWDDARLSHYKDEIRTYGGKDDVLLYGVELVSDVVPPRNYVLVDHHNGNQHLSSALEQVAEIIGYRLSGKEALVAANDRGYYPAMKEFLDSDPEYAEWSGQEKQNLMDEIRKEDWKAQGVTEEEERMAEAIVPQVYGEYKVVVTGLEHFSPICDRLWPYERLFVLRPVAGSAALSYYGKDAQLMHGQVCSSFFKDASESRTYYGGGKDGFWGTGDKDTDVTVLKSIIKSYIPDFQL